MTDYHICRYDPVLGVVVCVGDDSDVLVLGKNMCRRRISVQRGVHWLDCFLYAGTCSLLLLSPEGVECVNYQTCQTTTSIRSSSSAKLTCMHVPQGLTCGAVGRRDGVVSFFRLCDVSETEQKLFWTVAESNLIAMAKVYIQDTDPIVTKLNDPSEEQKFYPFGSVLSIDTLPENPGTLVGIVAGLPGVLEWSVGVSYLSTFYSARSAAGESDTSMLAACKYTPGGNFVVATNTESDRVFIWSLSQKKKGKLSEVYWVVDLSARISHDVQVSSVEAFQHNEYCVSIYMARTKSAAGGSVSDKNSQWYLLINGQRDIVEVVLRVEEKLVVDQEQVIADLNTHTAHKGVAAGAKRLEGSGQNGAAANFYKVFHVEPCTPRCYWNSQLTDFDLDSLIVTSSGGLHPLVVKRKKEGRGIESIQELKEIQSEAPWGSLSTLLRLHFSEQETVMRGIATQMTTSALDEILFGGSNLFTVYAGKAITAGDLNEEKRRAASQAYFASVISWGSGVVLLPGTDQVLRVDPCALQKVSLWTAMQDPMSLITLEEALPPVASRLPTEVILRVSISAQDVIVTKYVIRLGRGRATFVLNRKFFGLHESSKPIASVAKIVDASMEKSQGSDRVVATKASGKCLLLVLEDSSIAVVDLSGINDSQGEPHKLTLASSSFLPSSEDRVCQVDTFFHKYSPSHPEGLYVVALLSQGQSLVVWNLSTMKCSFYPQSSPATRLLIANLKPPTPNFSSDVKMLSIDLSVLTRPSEPGSSGQIVMKDAAGEVLYLVDVGFGADEQASREWCYRVTQNSTSEAWQPTGFLLDTKKLIFSYSIRNDRQLHWRVSTESTNNYVDGDTVTLRSVISDVSVSWTRGKAVLFTQLDEDSLPKRQILVNPPTAGGEVEVVSDPVVVLVGKNFLSALNFSRICSGDYMGTGNEDAVPSIHLDASRTLEDVLLLDDLKAVIAITRDGNGWRWINLIDYQTLKSRMPPFATLDFAGEEHIKVLSVSSVISTGRNEHHLYFVGTTDGAVGHYCITDNLIETAKSNTDPFWPKIYESVPGSFTSYHRYLPRRPTQKAETNFFSRLMSRPWEDLAAEMIGKTFKQVRTERSLPSPVSSEPPIVKKEASPPEPKAVKPEIQNHHVDTNEASSFTRRDEGVERSTTTSSISNHQRPIVSLTQTPSSEPSGYRYAQVKEVAQRENVSLTEARRMMSENMRKLQQRAERLGAVADKSEQLANQAMSFQDLARQLKEKQRNSWL